MSTPIPFPLILIRQQAAPIDTDTVFATTVERMAYLTSPRRYGGLVAFDMEMQQLFVLNADRTAWLTIGGGGGGETPDLRTTHTIGSTLSIANGSNIVVINPDSTLPSLTVTLPAVAHVRNQVEFYFGGALNSGSIVSQLFIQPNANQSLIQATVPVEVLAGEHISYIKIDSIWYRKY